MIDEMESAWRSFVRLVDQEQASQENWPGQYPHYSVDGVWRRMPIDATSGWVDEEFYDHGNWTAGFGVGEAWLKGLKHDGSVMSDCLRRTIADISTRAGDNTTHDLGFLFYPAFSLGLMLGHLTEHESVPALHAAAILSSRFNDRGQYIQAFGETGDPRSAGTSTIDTMMNLPLLWWSSSVSEARVVDYERALAHAITSALNFFRPDGSTFHLIRFDPSSGQLLEQGTFQGATSGSCWSRGQAWAITGFAWAFGVTGDERLREAAELAWSYFEPRVPSDGVVPWDFADNSPHATSDASASAIAALGALLLAASHPNAAECSSYRSAGLSILKRLNENAVRREPRQEGVLLRSCYSKPHGLGVNGATPYGDFFYGLALALATGRIHEEQLFTSRIQTKGNPEFRSS